eukprot:4170871-Pyramimonas_sp.AAC.1
MGHGQWGGRVGLESKVLCDIIGANAHYTSVSIDHPRLPQLVWLNDGPGAQALRTSGCSKGLG